MLENEKKITLLDRFAVGILSGLSALLTLGILAIMLVYATEGAHVLITIKITLGVTIFFFILGFATLDNCFVSILNPIWKLIGTLVRWR